MPIQETTDISVATLSIEALPGDILLAKGPWPIRVCTGESFSHVALISRYGKQAEVHEYLSKGYNAVPLAEWFKDRKGLVLWGQAPATVIHEDIPKAVVLNGYMKYSYATAINIWLNQVFGRRSKLKRMVCSTFVQQCWKDAGWRGPERPMDPGDFLNHSGLLMRVNYE